MDIPSKVSEQTPHQRAAVTSLHQQAAFAERHPEFSEEEIEMLFARAYQGAQKPVEEEFYKKGHAPGLAECLAGAEGYCPPS